MAINLQDKNGQEVLKETLDSSLKTNELLQLILTELRLLNLYHSHIHDEELTIEDLDDEHN